VYATHECCEELLFKKCEVTSLKVHIKNDVDKSTNVRGNELAFKSMRLVSEASRTEQKCEIERDGDSNEGFLTMYWTDQLYNIMITAQF